MKRILILYRELAGYFVDCLNHLCENYAVEALVIAYPVHSDAPFLFNLSNKITLRNRNEFNVDQLREIITNGDFDLIFCGGWSDKAYLQAIKSRKCPSLLGFDNQWNGTFKHFLSSFYGKYFIRPLFEVAFVPGVRQFEFAQHLGFVKEKIIMGAYSCDVERFSSIFNIRKNSEVHQTKQLIYAGRYAEEKFIQELWNTFTRLHADSYPNWELHCIGTGPLWEMRSLSAGIFHHGFMQPAELFQFMQTGDAFILPSTFEPWGVVVHEFASAGFPIILSSAVGSGEIFLRDHESGFQFQNGNQTDMELKLRQLFSLTDEELKAMGAKSNELAKQITPDTWSKSLYQLM